MHTDTLVRTGLPAASLIQSASGEISEGIVEVVGWGGGWKKQMFLEVGKEEVEGGGVGHGRMEAGGTEPRTPMFSSSLSGTPAAPPRLHAGGAEGLSHLIQHTHSGPRVSWPALLSPVKFLKPSQHQVTGLPLPLPLLNTLQCWLLLLRVRAQLPGLMWGPGRNGKAACASRP